ncbi:GNAT family N-acetyltransferase [Streptomyces sp. NPDC127020]|uniref:GNAT family N-acetyltransferase n=1 Tax=Streptomyces sp. NPDC127020 TaxID=3347109 RepID=UPI003647975C
MTTPHPHAVRGDAEQQTIHDCGLVLRSAVAADVPAVEALHTRCSPHTLYRRYHAPVHGAPRMLLKHFLAGHSDYFVVTTPSSQAIALGEFAPATRGQQPQLALMVEDAWQRRGIGTWLTRRILRTAARARLRTVYADVLGENAPALQHFHGFGGVVQSWEQGTAQLAIPVTEQDTPLQDHDGPMAKPAAAS